MDMWVYGEIKKTHIVESCWNWNQLVWWLVVWTCGTWGVFDCDTLYNEC